MHRIATGSTRRQFVAAAASGAALTVAASGLAPVARAAEEASEGTFDPNDLCAGYRAEEYADKVSDTQEVDICVVGAGIAGIAAAIEAAQEGKTVALLESQDRAGGNGSYSDCVFSFGSPQQIAGSEAAGVEVTADQIIRSEIELYNYTVNGGLWADVLEHSADNTAWLVDAGCQVEETTVFYGGGLGKTPTALMWVGGVGSGDACAIQPMLATLAGLGVEPTCGARVRALLTDESGKVCGVYAETADGVLKVDAKAVILAGGGWGANPDLCSYFGGYDMSKSLIFSAPGCQGDTLRMAAAIGARQDAISRGYMFGNGVEGVSSSYLMSYHPALWVNEFGRRFANEDCAETCHDYTGTAVRSQGDVYIVVNDAMIDEMDSALAGGTNGDGTTTSDIRSQIEAAVVDEANKNVASGETAAELADALGIDPDAFAATLEEYEGYCAQGHDDMFGKNPEYLESLGEGKLYGMRVQQTICLSLGGIVTNRNWQVLDSSKKPIDGLYAVGADGQMVYLGLYNLNTSGGHMAVNFESGRYSVKHAVATYC